MQILLIHHIILPNLNRLFLQFSLEYKNIIILYEIYFAKWIQSQINEFNQNKNARFK